MRGPGVILLALLLSAEAWAQGIDRGALAEELDRRRIEIREIEEKLEKLARCRELIAEREYLQREILDRAGRIEERIRNLENNLARFEGKEKEVREGFARWFASEALPLPLEMFFLPVYRPPRFNVVDRFRDLYARQAVIERARRRARETRLLLRRAREELAAFEREPDPARHPGLDLDECRRRIARIDGLAPEADRLTAAAARAEAGRCESRRRWLRSRIREIEELLAGEGEAGPGPRSPPEKARIVSRIVLARPGPPDGALGRRRCRWLFHILFLDLNGVGLRTWGRVRVSREPMDGWGPSRPPELTMGRWYGIGDPALRARLGADAAVLSDIDPREWPRAVAMLMGPEHLIVAEDEGGFAGRYEARFAGVDRNGHEVECRVHWEGRLVPPWGREVTARYEGGLTPEWRKRWRSLVEEMARQRGLKVAGDPRFEATPLVVEIRKTERGVEVDARPVRMTLTGEASGRGRRGFFAVTTTLTFHFSGAVLAGDGTMRWHVRMHGEMRWLAPGERDPPPLDMGASDWTARPLDPERTRYGVWVVGGSGDPLYRLRRTK